MRCIDSFGAIPCRYDIERLIQIYQKRLGLRDVRGVFVRAYEDYHGGPIRDDFTCLMVMTDYERYMSAQAGEERSMPLYLKSPLRDEAIAEACRIVP